jgi:hypothetical protein
MRIDQSIFDLKGTSDESHKKTNRAFSGRVGRAADV